MTTPVDYSRQRLSFAQARQSPCSGCEATCCTVLPLHDFTISRLQELDYALFLLNFERIELAWLAGGTWRVHYRMPCSNLDLDTRLCKVHDTPLQPSVCKRYDPYACFYKRIFQSPEQPQPTFIRFDRQRLRAFADMLVFDGNREIVGVPDVSAVADRLPAMLPFDDPPPPPAPMPEQWEHAARTGTGLPGPQLRTFHDFDSPCTGCAAYCCERLSFPHAAPSSVGNLDHLRFCLGFPGVEVGINESEEWTILVHTRCKHLVRGADGAGRCGIFGDPERPQVCSIYDASLCGYKYQFGQPRPERFLRLRSSEFEVASALFQLDDHGYVLHRPGYREIRQGIEHRWASEGPVRPEQS